MHSKSIINRYYVHSVQYKSLECSLVVSYYPHKWKNRVLKVTLFCMTDFILRRSLNPLRKPFLLSGCWTDTSRSRWFCMMDQNLLILFSIHISITCDMISNTTGWNGAPNHDGASSCFTDDSRNSPFNTPPDLPT